MAKRGRWTARKSFSSPPWARAQQGQQRGRPSRDEIDDAPRRQGSPSERQQPRVSVRKRTIGYEGEQMLRGIARKRSISQQHEERLRELAGDARHRRTARKSLTSPGHRLTARKSLISHDHERRLRDATQRARQPTDSSSEQEVQPAGRRTISQARSAIPPDEGQSSSSSTFDEVR